MKRKKIILLIMDGFGVGKESVYNPFKLSKTPFLDYIKSNYPFLLLSASGRSQGLFSNEPGNCEMGHLTIGTGVVYYQPRIKIDLEVESGNLKNNPILISLANYLKTKNSKLHLLGLLTENQTKFSFDHLYFLIEFFQEKGLEKIFLHLFTDGIESRTKSVLALIEKLINDIKSKNYKAKISTLCGRLFALDETEDYIFKTKPVFYLLLEGKGKKIDDIKLFLEEKYKDPKFNVNLLEPIILDENGLVNNNDVVLFFNSEGKSFKQLMKAFLDPNFDKFERPKREGLIVSSLVRYIDFSYPVIIKEQKIKTNLSRVLSDHGLSQLKIVDASREKLLSYYFNGFIEEKHNKETFKILPPISETSFIKEKKEEIFNNIRNLLDYLIISLKDKYFDFIVTNIPLFDIVGHTGDLNLAIKSIEFFDELLKIIVEEALKEDYTLIITSDHGNLETIIDIKSGKKHTGHTLNPVPFILIDKDYKKTRENKMLSQNITGSLVDIPVTILDLMKIEIPENFEGKSLLKYI